MRVLFVAFEFAPLASGGVHRSIGFAKYLPDYGITPVVLTTDQASYESLFNNQIDLGLLKELPDGLVIERLPCSPPATAGQRANILRRRSFFSILDDTSRAWGKALTKNLPRLVKIHKPDALYVSIPPFGLASIVARFAERNKVPLVIDFRDAWSQLGMAAYRSYAHYYLTMLLERKSIERACRVVCASDQIRKDLLITHGSLPTQKLTTITNGFDANIDNWSLRKRHKRNAEVVIGYVGSFYYDPRNRQMSMLPWWRRRPDPLIRYSPRQEDWLYRSPYFVFKAVSCLLRSNPEFRSVIKIRFAGARPDWIDDQINEFGLADTVEFVGYLDHKRTLEFESACDYLLVTSSKVIGGFDYSIAGKTFEYFSARKPILGFVSEGAQKEILTRSGVSLICDPDDPEGSARSLLNLIQDRVGFTPNVSFLDGLHRRELTKSLAECFRDCTTKA